MAMVRKWHPESLRMTFPKHFPVGGLILDSWSRVGDGESDGGTIEIPAVNDAAPAVIALQWQTYENPDDGSSHYVASFSHGGETWLVKERYEYMHVDERGTFRRRFRDRGYQACCTELVQAVHAGDTLAPESIDRGAYRGMWRCDMHVARPEPTAGIALEEMACRVVFNFSKRAVLLFRWRYVEWE